uniref:DMAP1-binding domain-containing protein n=1 Tax=Panagrellus redivivus TaxID=6233 RepID=A0A7E4W2L2_PANRE
MREKTIVDLSQPQRHISYVSYYSSSDDDDSTLDSARGTKTKQSPNMANKPLPKSPVPTESNNNHHRHAEDDPPKPLPRFLRHRSQSRDRNADRDRGRDATPVANGTSPMQRVLNEENRLRKQNKRSSQIFGVEPTYAPAIGSRTPKEPTSGNSGGIGDRALPEPPIEEPDEEAPIDSTKLLAADDEDAAYVNCTYTNDSGLGSATGVPVGPSGAPASGCQDYANTRIPLRPVKVSAKIQQIMQSLQCKDVNQSPQHSQACFTVSENVFIYQSFINMFKQTAFGPGQPCLRSIS